MDTTRDTAEIRRMRDADTVAMHEVHTKAVRRVCARLLDSDIVDAWLCGRTPAGYLAAAEQGGERFWVAANEEQVIGFASWRREELLSLFIDPDIQGRGLGRLLFAVCENDAIENGNAILRLNSTLNARTFYAALGFQEIREGYTEKRNKRIPHVEMSRQQS